MNIVSFDGHLINDGLKYDTYPTGLILGLPEVRAEMVERQGNWPLIGGINRPPRLIIAETILHDADNRAELLRWFDPEDETPKPLVIEDDDGSNDRSVNAVVLACTERDGDGLTYAVVFQVHDDVRWRGVTDETHVETGLADSDTFTVTAGGEDRSYPIYTITPRGAKSSGRPYRRWVAVRWNLDAAAVSYPVDIVNASLDTRVSSTNFADSLGRDIVLVVDGAQTNRLVSGPDTATTKIWASLSFDPRQEFTLAADIGSGDTVETLTVNESIVNLPASGIIIINSEAFYYGSKVDSTLTLTGVQRAARGTSAGNHTAGDDVWWVQHDIFIEYGYYDSSVKPLEDETKEPVIDKASSTNSAWVYANFGQRLVTRPGMYWTSLAQGFYFTAHDAPPTGDIWDVLGLRAQGSDNPIQYVTFYNGLRVTQISALSFEKWRYSSSYQTYTMESSVIGEGEFQVDLTLASPTLSATWQTETAGPITVLTDARYIRFRQQRTNSAWSKSELDDITIAFNSNDYPTVTIGAEESNYSMDLTITNETTGDQVRIILVTAVDESIVLNSDEKSLLDADGISRLSGLYILGNVRREWLPLVPGDNTLRVDDTGMTDVDIEMAWKPRFYA